MADTFAEQLRAELDGIQVEIHRLERKRDLISQLLSTEGGVGTSVATAALDAPRRPAPRRMPRTGRQRQRRPRGLISAKVREYLGAQSEPAHASQILKYLEDHDAAPQSEKPLPTLQSTLQRMKEMGEVENRGRNRWMLVGSSSEPAQAPSEPSSPAASPSLAPAPLPEPQAPAYPATPPVVTSTTTFATRPAGQ